MSPVEVLEHPIVQEANNTAIIRSAPNFPDIAAACKKSYEAKKNVVCDMTKNELACLRSSIVPQEVEPAIQTNESLHETRTEQEFIKKYEMIVQALCETYNIPKNRFFSLISRETDFIDHFQAKRTNRASFGFCQLTKTVFADMKANTKSTPGGRGDQFVPFLNKALNNESVCDVISSGASGVACKEVLDILRDSCSNGKITDKQRYNQAIESLYALARKDQHVNLFVSALFQDFHASNIARSNSEPTCETSPKNLAQWRKII
jgi:hypothetical protein